MSTGPQRARMPQDGYGGPTPKKSLDQGKKKPRKKPWVQRLVWKKLAVSLVFVYVVVHLIGGCFTIVDLKKQEQVIATELAQAKIEQSGLEALVSYMSTDEAVEKLAREKLGLIKPGEIVVVRADDANPAPE